MPPFAGSASPVRVAWISCFLVLAWGFAAGLAPGQEAVTGPLPGGASDSAGTEAVLVALARKANGGDEASARGLAAAILKAKPVAMDDTFRKEVESASEVEAKRILGVTLLRTGDAALEKQGVSFVDAAIEGQSALAMELKARILLEGSFGFGKSVDEAVELLKTARQLPGALESHRLLGDLALAGAGMPKDAAIALEYYRRGAEAGSISCQLALHRLFREGRELPKDPVEAERYGRAAAETGDAEAAYELGLFYEQFSGETPEWLRAAEWMRTASERGSIPATLRLADYHLAGRLGSINGEEGTRLLRAAANLGSPEACFRIGEAYKNGVHVPQDPVASTAWFRVAAELGNAIGENAYGLALATGYGVRADPAAATEWFRSASQKGNLDAKVNLGEQYHHGFGVERDTGKAAGYLEEAALGGSPAGAHKLAQLLSAEGGRDAGRAVDAAFWAAKAVALGSADAATLAERLRAQLTPVERSEVDRRLSEKVAGKAAQRPEP